MPSMRWNRQSEVIPVSPLIPFAKNRTYTSLNRSDFHLRALYVKFHVVSLSLSCLPPL